MAAARYWRIVGLSARGGGDLELSALHLYDGNTRVDAGLTPTCSHAPASGALANLSDADLDTTCRFAAADVRCGGFWLEWDFGGSPAQVTFVRPGSGALRSTFLAGAMLQSRATSTDAWGNTVALGQYPWPGSAALTPVSLPDDSVLRLHGDGGDGSITIVDSSPIARSPSALGSATISIDKSTAYGGAAIKFNGSSALKYAHTADLSPSTDFAVRLRLWVPSQSGNYRIIIIKAATTGHRPYSIQLNPSGFIEAHCSNTTPSLVQVTSTSKVSAAAWNYIEFNRVGGTIRLFLNGNLEASAAVSGNNYFNSSDPLCIGADGDSTPKYPLYSGAPAYIEELSLTPGGGAIASYAPPSDADSPSIFQPFAIQTPADKQLIAFSAPVPAASVRGTQGSRLARDTEFGGGARIAGDVGIKGASGAPDTMTQSRVRLLRARDGLLARETWSDAATGAFAFDGLDETTEFIALAQDSSGSFRPVAADRVLPEVPA